MSALAVFNFTEENPVRVQMIQDEPWFVAVDVCRILGIKQATRAVESLDDDEKGVINTHTPGGIQDLLAVAESGLYALVFKSRKPEAKTFRKWVTSEVLPSIRKTGGYGEAPYRGDPLSMTHRADIAVAADRTFRSWMRSGRSAGLSTSQALRRANEQTRLATGIDMLAELDVAADVETEPVLSAERFLKCWQDEALDAPFDCCAFADLYRYYRHWCGQQAEPWPISKNKFSQSINATPGMRTARKAVFSADGRRSVVNCVMLTGDPVPQNESIQSWLMIRLSAFRDAIGGAL